MKKRKVILLGVLMLVACSFLCGCFETSVNSSDSAANEMLNFEEIEERKGLAYEKETKVIYYMASTNAYNGYSFIHILLHILVKMVNFVDTLMVKLLKFPKQIP